MKRKTTKRERGGRERGKKRRKKRRERPVSNYGTVSNANGQRAFSLRLIGSRTRMIRATRMTRTSSALPSVSCRRPWGEKRFPAEPDDEDSVDRGYLDGSSCFT